MGSAVRVRVYCDESDHSGHAPLTSAIVRLLWKEHAAGVTVLTGVEGFGGSRALHSARSLELGASRPCIVEWIDSPERFDAIWPRLAPLVAGAVVTKETVEALVLPHHGLRRLSRDLSVAEVMQRDVVTVLPDTTVSDVVSAVRERGLRFVPVVSDGRVVGVITAGDLMEPAAAGASASGVMTAEVVKISPDASIAEAAELMLERRLKRLPVVDASGRLVGVVSRVDVLRTIADVYPDAEEEPASDGGRTAAAFATLHVPTASPATGIAELVDLVASTRLNRVVVVDGEGRPVGVVSDTELLGQVGADRRWVDRLRRRPAASHPGPHANTAAEVMNSHPLLVPGETPIREAVRSMVERREKLIVVVDREGRLLGMIDRAGALRALSLP